MPRRPVKHILDVIPMGERKKRDVRFMGGARKGSKRPEQYRA